MDGGATWQTTRRPDLVGLSADELACPAPDRCVAVVSPHGAVPALRTGSAPLQAPADLVLVSSDEGRSWQRAQLPGELWLGGLSCPTAELCYASAELRGKPARRLLIESTDGGRRWSAGHTGPPESLGAISCPSTGHCWAVGGPSLLSSTDDGGATWRAAASAAGLGGQPTLAAIDCPTTSRCVAVGEDNELVTPGAFPHPALFALSTTDAGRQWRFSSILRGFSPIGMPGFEGLSCSRDGLSCAAGAAEGTVAVTSDGGLHWSVVARRGRFQSVDAVSCAALVGCLLAGTGIDAGAAIASTQLPSAGTPLQALDMRYSGIGGEWTSIACPGVEHCVAVGGGPPQQPSFAEVMTSDDGGETWVERPSPAGVLSMSAVACPSASRCYATGIVMLPRAEQTIETDQLAVVLESDDGGRSWHRAGAAPGLVYLNGIACPSRAACFAVGDTVSSKNAMSDAVLATTDGGLRWREQAVPSSNGGVLLGDVACASATFCWAGGGTGLYATVDGGARWKMLQSAWVDGVSCPIPSRCVALGVIGQGRSRRWDSSTEVPRTADLPSFLASPTAATCPSLEWCVAIGSLDEAVTPAALFTSSDGGLRWSAQPVPQLLAISGGFQAPDSYYPWPTPVGDGAGYSAIACPTASRCVVLGSGAVTESVEIASTGRAASRPPPTPSPRP